jgi:photosystem I P700 chlorophyll a apoprotein A2
MATRFPKFSQVLSEDPTTRRIWYSIGTAHDLEMMMMLLKKLYIKRFSLLILVTLQLFFFGQQVIYST